MSRVWEARNHRWIFLVWELVGFLILFHLVLVFSCRRCTWWLFCSDWHSGRRASWLAWYRDRCMWIRQFMSSRCLFWGRWRYIFDVSCDKSGDLLWIWWLILIAMMWFMVFIWLIVFFWSRRLTRLAIVNLMVVRRGWDSLFMTDISWRMRAMNCLFLRAILLFIAILLKLCLVLDFRCTVWEICLF